MKEDCRGAATVYNLADEAAAHMHSHDVSCMPERHEIDILLHANGPAHIASKSNWFICS